MATITKDAAFQGAYHHGKAHGLLQAAAVARLYGSEEIAFALFERARDTLAYAAEWYDKAGSEWDATAARAGMQLVEQERDKT